MTNLNPDQFTEWFHGTSASNAKKIQEEGLTARQYGIKHNNEHYTLSRARDLAEGYAETHELSNKLKRRTDPRVPYDPGAVVTVRIPHAQAHEYLVTDPFKQKTIKGPKDSGLPDTTHIPGTSGLHQPIPPHMIV